MNTLEGHRDHEVTQEVVDMSAEFQSMRTIEFLELLREYRNKHVHLRITVPWTGNENTGIRLKAFYDDAPEYQKREVTITGTEEERQQALTKPHMANVLNSGVTWIIVE